VSWLNSSFRMLRHADIETTPGALRQDAFSESAKSHLEIRSQLKTGQENRVARNFLILVAPA
jgi:hypothetical protein